MLLSYKSLAKQRPRVIGDHYSVNAMGYVHEHAGDDRYVRQRERRPSDICEIIAQRFIQSAGAVDKQLPYMMPRITPDKNGFQTFATTQEAVLQDYATHDDFYAGETHATEIRRERVHRAAKKQHQEMRE